MSANETSGRSRRAILAAAGGGLAAIVAQAIGRPLPASATHGDVHLGADNYASTLTEISNTSETGSALQGYAQGSGIGAEGKSISGYGVSGSSLSGIGVVGWSSAERGVYAYSGSSQGAYAYSDAGGASAVLGWSAAANTGIYGYSGTAQPPASPAKTGVYGYAAQDVDARGVTGETIAGRGVAGIATTGVGVHASAGTGGTALQASGRVAFSTAGLAVISVGVKSKTVAPGIDLTAASAVLCTLESNQAGLLIQRVTKDTATDTFKVFLNLAVQSGKTAKVAWFVIG